MVYLVLKKISLILGLQMNLIMESRNISIEELFIMALSVPIWSILVKVKSLTLKLKLRSLVILHTASKQSLQMETPT